MHVVTPELGNVCGNEKSGRRMTVWFVCHSCQPALCWCSDSLVIRAISEMFTHVLQLCSWCGSQLCSWHRAQLPPSPPAPCGPLVWTLDLACSALLTLEIHSALVLWCVSRTPGYSQDSKVCNTESIHKNSNFLILERDEAALVERDLSHIFRYRICIYVTTHLDPNIQQWPVINVFETLCVAVCGQ